MLTKPYGAFMQMWPVPENVLISPTCVCVCVCCPGVFKKMSVCTFIIAPVLKHGIWDTTFDPLNSDSLPCVIQSEFAKGFEKGSREIRIDLCDGYCVSFNRQQGNILC